MKPFYRIRKKLSSQIEECNALSERLSSLVRKLDLKQIRAQKALSTTEDILNLKECKRRLLTAIEEKDLTQAVNCIKQVHEINEKAAKTSEDYEIILLKEQEVKELVRNEFQKAITESNTNGVMALCPLLQTLHLEAEARDNFLTFMESKVFIAVSADAASAVEGVGTTDPSTAYAQALSNVFNSTCLIIQQYLPMVIQGLENSLGDIHFIRRLHKRCEQEAGLVLKRYMKYRGVKEMIGNLKNLNNNSTTIMPNPTPGGSVGTPGNPNNSGHSIQAELHTVMNELALLIQYCCKYLKYLRSVCHGAENKIRSSTTLATTTIIVFSGPLEFDKMIDELINKFYMEGEQYLMKSGVNNVLPKILDVSSSGMINLRKEMKLDECFFILQKCGLRSIASHNIHAACACLTFISDVISNDLLTQGMDMLMNCINKLVVIVQDHINRYRKRMVSNEDSSQESSSSNLSYGITKGFSNAMSLASTIAGGSGTEASNTAGPGGQKDDISFHEDGTFTVPSLYPDRDDPWGSVNLLEAFNIIELCIRYTERLNKDLYQAGQNVFMTDEDELNELNQASNSLGKQSKYSKTGDKKGSSGGNKNVHITTEFERIKLCKENFDNLKTTYTNALRQGAERYVAMIQNIVKEILLFTLSKNAVYGGLKFDEKDSNFDKQPILILLPKILTIPIETIIQISTFHLSEKNKDLIINLLADYSCEKIEQFIFQTRFSLSGALKMEEIIRALNNLFSRHSSIPIRGKFSRLRELLMVLTSEKLSDVMNDNFTHLLNNDISNIYQLRVDGSMD